jgi:DivIVA domain-containing protein
VTLIHLLIVLAVLAAVAAVAAGKVRGGLPEPTSTRPDVELAGEDLGPVGTDDVDQVRFSVGFRGYRMDEVDDVLDRLGLELGARDEQIRELREQLSGGPESVASSTVVSSTSPSSTVPASAERSTSGPATAEPDDSDLPPAG